MVSFSGVFLERMSPIYILEVWQLQTILSSTFVGLAVRNSFACWTPLNHVWCRLEFLLMISVFWNNLLFLLSFTLLNQFVTWLSKLWIQRLHPEWLNMCSWKTCLHYFLLEYFYKNIIFHPWLNVYQLHIFKFEIRIW